MLGKLRSPRRASLKSILYIRAAKHSRPHLYTLRKTLRRKFGVGTFYHFVGVVPRRDGRVLGFAIEPPDGLLDSHFVIALGGRFTHPAISELPKMDAALTLYIVVICCHCSFVILPPRVMRNGV